MRSTSSLQCPLLVPKQCLVLRKAQPLAAFFACFPLRTDDRVTLFMLRPEHPVPRTPHTKPLRSLRGAVRLSRQHVSGGTALLKRLALGEF